jgi:hypothetical protein
VISSTYAGTAATVTVGQTLPGGGTAIADGTYPDVFENATVDGSFGVTSPLILREYVLHGHNRSAVLVKTLNVTDRTGIVTSFSSKSELALNLSTSQGADQHARRVEFQYAQPCRSDQSSCFSSNLSAGHCPNRCRSIAPCDPGKHL